MKLFLISAICIGIGFTVHHVQRLDTRELEARATVAWNAGDLVAAENLARTALGRKSDSPRAREVLVKLADVLKQPEIPFAFLLEQKAANSSQELILGELGRMALLNNQFRLADEYFGEASRQYPKNDAFQRQYVALSGLRLDAAEMQRRMLDWTQHGHVSAEMVVMSLGLWSLDSRGAAPAETWLRAAVEADSSDLESRWGLARCLQILGRYQECIQLLKPYARHPHAAVLLAAAYATTNDFSGAEALLPSSEPAETRGEFWFTKGLISLARREILESETAFQNAVRYQPLNKSFRSRYCDVLRRQDQLGRRSQNVKELEIVVRIVQRTTPAGMSRESDLLAGLAMMCKDVGADDAAILVERAAR